MKKIAILGPENSGKSTLSEQLSSTLDAALRKEYARDYLLANPPPYTYADLDRIAYTQWLQEQKIMQESQGKGLLVCDTEFLVLKVWSAYVFGGVHPFILQGLNKQYYDHYFLCKPDLDWVDDGLREYPDMEERMQLFQLYQGELDKRACPYSIIEGTNRWEQALEVLKKIF